MKMRRDGSAPVASRAMPLETRRHRDDPARLVQCLFLSVILLASGNARSSRSLRDPTLSRSGPASMQGQIVLRRYQCQQPSGVLILDPRVGRAAHRLAAAVPVSSSDAASSLPSRPHRKTGGCRPAARTRLNVAITRFRKSANRLQHPCWPLHQHRA